MLVLQHLLAFESWYRVMSNLSLNKTWCLTWQGGHKPENSGNLKNCQNLRENSGKLELLRKKPGKLRENEKYLT